MTILSTRKLICDKMYNEFNILIRPIDSIKDTTKTQIDQVKSKLTGMNFSPPSEIADTITNLENDVQGMVPGVDNEDIDETLDFINNCDFLNENEILRNPISLLKGGTTSVIGEVAGLITELSGLLPEFDAAEIIENILNKFASSDSGIPNTLDLTNLIQSMEKLINCMSNRCGSEFASRVSSMTDTLDGVYTELNIVSDPIDPNWGKFDLEQLYTDTVLSSQEKIQMSNVVDSVTNSKSTVVDSVDGIVNKMKSTIRVVEGIF